jgi:antitoxin (DNA-binding transcriptional repressor) of toxin-antitoxin stability system
MTITIAISQFKSQCLEIIDKLQNNQETIIITKRDKPIAKVQAIMSKSNSSLFGILKNKAEIKGDILEPINEKWDAAHE